VTDPGEVDSTTVFLTFYRIFNRVKILFHFASSVATQSSVAGETRQQKSIDHKTVPICVMRFVA
jgi:hypothetical protein